MDLVGEIKASAAGAAYFQRGITEYPMIGEPAMLMSDRELRLIYNGTSTRPSNIGALQQDSAIPAQVDVEQLVSKHFAVVGTTGVGKSNGVAILLTQILDERPDLRVFLIDPHNEYGRCFGDKAQVLTRAICGCRSGCSTSRKRSMRFSGAVPASTTRSRFCRKPFRRPRPPTCSSRAPTTVR